MKMIIVTIFQLIRFLPF